MQKLLLSNFFLGGISDSQYAGIPNSVAALQNVNLHGEPGVAKVNQAMTKESGSVVDDEVSVIVPCSDGKEYLFSKSTGKIWSRTSAGAYTLEATNSAAQPGILGAAEYNGYLYYAAQTKLGRWQIGSAWATRNDAWATFTNSNASYKPMIVKNIILHIGDGNLIAQVDDSSGSAVFTVDALDLEDKYVVTALGEYSEDVLIGAYVNTNVATTKIFRWDTYSVSFTSSDVLPEMKINCFIPTDNYVLVSAGQKGNLYVYGGVQLEQFKRIPGNWDSSNEAFVYGAAAVNFKGLPLFCLSNGSGNPATLGVYSLGSYSANYPKVLNLEYTLSHGHTSNVQITAMCVAGNDLIVAWKDTTSGTVYGVDKVNWSVKSDSAFLTLRSILSDRMEAKDLKIKIAYRTLNGGTISLYQATNAGTLTAVALENDVINNMYRNVSRITSANTVQFKVVFNRNTDDTSKAPEIEAIEISYE